MIPNNLGFPAFTKFGPSPLYILRKGKRTVDAPFRKGRKRMTRGDLLALFITMACSSAGAMSARAPEIWKPSTPPAECRQISVEFILLDVSRSMLKGGQFRDLQQQIADSIGAAPACRLMILGTFGLTADVRAAEFMTGKAARQRLMEAVWRQRPTSGATNLDEAAKVVELLAYQLQAAYGRQGEALIVTAYTDNIDRKSTRLN